jgi:hypothetical protein
MQADRPLKLSDGGFNLLVLGIGFPEVSVCFHEDEERVEQRKQRDL